MIFAVEWSPSAERELTELWTNGPDRAAIQAAGDALDEALNKDPLGVGESRAGATRIAFHRPLAICFDVDVQQHKVLVWAVGRAKRTRP
jgi:mRNA-degrading endonuclease RelE of RelBE toxin-antitoxin system